jgi:hypothetical protein
MSHDITKLPKWAQDKITALENRAKRAEQTLAEGPEDSNVFADPYRASRPLGLDTHILFEMKEDSIYVNPQGDELVISSGFKPIAVLPQSSNFIRVRVL